MDKLIDAFVKALENLDPRTALVILILLMIIGGLTWIIKKVVSGYKAKDVEISDLHKSLREDSNANIKLIIELQNNIEQQITQGRNVDELVKKIYDMVKTIEVKIENLK